MDIRIGIAQSGQVVEVELAEDADRAELKARIDVVLGSADDAGAVLWLVDRRGKETGIPAARISFVELGAADADRRIGFGA
ncbi:MAG: DUF3107 domain-containing protein [Actinomycetota bacterium]|nr:DUF3107 domain-containing protein [Actinomycetota bacterium]